MMKLMQSFQWVAFRNNYSTLPCKHIGFEGDFYSYLSDFVGRDIKLLFIWGSHIKYLSPFAALVLILLRAGYLLYFFPTLQFLFKKNSLGMQCHTGINISFCH